jgi:hypothetical protein
LAIFASAERTAHRLHPSRHKRFAAANLIPGGISRVSPGTDVFLTASQIPAATHTTPNDPSWAFQQRETGYEEISYVRDYRRRNILFHPDLQRIIGSDRRSGHPTLDGARDVGYRGDSKRQQINFDRFNLPVCRNTTPARPSR